jgi:hypothetical protein
MRDEATNRDCMNVGKENKEGEWYVEYCVVRASSVYRYFTLLLGFRAVSCLYRVCSRLWR